MLIKHQFPALLVPLEVEQERIQVSWSNGPSPVSPINLVNQSEGRTQVLGRETPSNFIEDRLISLSNQIRSPI